MKYNIKEIRNLNIKDKKGQAALSLVLLVGGTVVLIAATLFFLVISFLNATFGFQAANQAWGLAISGANDALLQLVRNPMMDDTVYDFEVSGNPVKVEILRGCYWDSGSVLCFQSDSSGIKKPYQVVINSSASVSGRGSRLKVFASLGEDGLLRVIEVSYYGLEGGSSI